MKPGLATLLAPLFPALIPGLAATVCAAMAAGEALAVPSPIPIAASEAAGVGTFDMRGERQAQWPGERPGNDPIRGTGEIDRGHHPSRHSPTQPPATYPAYPAPLPRDRYRDRPLDPHDSRTPQQYFEGRRSREHQAPGHGDRRPDAADR